MYIEKGENSSQRQVEWSGVEWSGVEGTPQQKEAESLFHHYIHT